jgi:phage gp46-like protein
MAWDLQIENTTGDLVFSPSHDLAGVYGEGLLRQRVSMRCKVPRGSYLYDYDGDFGSDLYLVSRSPSLAQAGVARAAIMDALQPMADEIHIDDIDISVTDQNQLQASILFSTIKTDADNPVIDPSTDVDVDAISVDIVQD